MTLAVTRLDGRLSKGMTCFVFKIRRKLNVNMFGIYSERNKTMSVYVYTAREGGKGPNQVS